MTWDLTGLLALWAAALATILVLERLRRRVAPARRPLPLVASARGLLPVLLVLVGVRGFLVEPYRIPSDSMLPTLETGDFIAVDKQAYAWRLPLLNTTLVTWATPVRGDIVVFRNPRQANATFIKRLVGLPGDRIRVVGDAVWVNDEPVPARRLAAFRDDRCYEGFTQGEERLGSEPHELLVCTGTPQPFRCDDRVGVRCGADAARPGPLGGATADFEGVVPAGRLFFLGDNRDNSADSRFEALGFVPIDHVIGRASRVLFNLRRGNGPRWQRLGLALR